MREVKDPFIPIKGSKSQCFLGTNSSPLSSVSAVYTSVQKKKHHPHDAGGEM